MREGVADKRPDTLTTLSGIMKGAKRWVGTIKVRDLERTLRDRKPDAV